MIISQSVDRASAQHLRKAFDKIERDFGRPAKNAAMRQLMYQATEPIWRATKARAKVRTGKLQRKVTRRGWNVYHTDDLLGIVGIEIRENTKSPVSIFQTLAVEYGTRKQEARSFIRAGFLAGYQAAAQYIARRTGDEIEREARKLYRNRVRRGHRL